MTPLANFLSQVKARLEKATPGLETPGYKAISYDACKEDRDLIANAPTDLKKLIEIVEVYHEALEDSCWCENGQRECEACEARAKANAIVGGRG